MTNKDIDGRRHPPARPADRTTLDEVLEASFPASDPPAVWTWDVEPAAEA